MNEPVSIIMPLYNGGQYLNEAVDSVLNQHCKNWELVLVDDGSTDNTQQICEQYRDADNRIKYYRYNDQRVTPPENWNRAFLLAKSSYFIMFHQDDIMHPDLVQELLDFVQEHPGITWASVRAEMIDTNGKTIYQGGKKYIKPSTFDSWDFEKNAVFNGTAVADYIMSRVFFNASGCIFNRQLALSIPLFDKRFFLLFDAEYFSRLSELGDVGYLSNVLLQYRHHNTSGMSNTFSKGLNGTEAYTMVEEYFERKKTATIFSKDHIYAEHAKAAFRQVLVYMKSKNKPVSKFQMRICLKFCELAHKRKADFLAGYFSHKYFNGSIRKLLYFFFKISLTDNFFKGGFNA